MSKLRKSPLRIAMGVVGLMAIVAVGIYLGVVAQAPPAGTVEVAMHQYAEGATKVPFGQRYASPTHGRNHGESGKRNP